MELVELWFVRRVLLGQAVLMAAIVLLAYVVPAHVNVDTDTEFPIGGHGVPVSLLVILAAVCATIAASVVGALLRRSDDTRELVWTRPIARRALAWRFVGVDALGLAISLALSFLAAVAILARIGLPLNLDPNAGLELALGCGCVAMWYGLTLLLSTVLRGGLARAVAGLMWPVALFSIPLGAQSPPPTVLHAIARWLDVINPLVYLEVGSARHADAAHALWTLPADQRAVVVWLFAAAFCVIAVELWRRQEI